MEEKLAKLREKVEERYAVEVEAEQRRVTERLLETLDEESRAEITDSAWLKNEVKL